MTWNWNMIHSQNSKSRGDIIRLIPPENESPEPRVPNTSRVSSQLTPFESHSHYRPQTTEFGVIVSRHVLIQTHQNQNDVCLFLKPVIFRNMNPGSFNKATSRPHIFLM